MHHFDILAVQYPNGVFRLPLLTKWLVICSGPQLLEEIRRANDNELSIDLATQEVTVIMHYQCNSSYFHAYSYFKLGIQWAMKSKKTIPMS